VRTDFKGFSRFSRFSKFSGVQVPRFSGFKFRGSRGSGSEVLGVQVPRFSGVQVPRFSGFKFRGSRSSGFEVFGVPVPRFSGEPENGTARTSEPEPREPPERRNLENLNELRF
jgi:hypothetical protein